MTCAMPLDVIRTRLVAQGNQGVVYRGCQMLCYFYAFNY